MKNEEYEKFKLKYHLPELGKLDTYFVLSLNDETNILIQIKEKIEEKFKTYLEIIEQIFYPDSSLTSIYESEKIGEKERKEMYFIYKKMMVVIRNSELIAIENKEEEIANFIKNSCVEWENIKENLADKINLLKEIWEKEYSSETNENYFG